MIDLKGTWTSFLDYRPPLGHLALFYLAFILAAGFGQWLAVLPGITIIVWPPNGVFIAVLLLNRKPSWPWWVIVGLFAELTCNALWFDNAIPLAIAYNGANALESVTGAWLLSRFFPSPARLRTLPQVFAFVGLGVAVAPVIAATIGCTIDALVGKHAFITAWPLWWIGDATGVLIAAPLTLVIVEAWRDRIKIAPAQIAEAFAVGVVLVGLGIMGFGGDLSFAYIVLPPLLWTAVRFEFAGAASASAFVALMVAVFTLAGIGQVDGDAEAEMHRHVMMQLFLAITALTGLVVAAISRQHRQALVTLRAANDELEMRVAERTATLRDSEARLQLALSAGRAGTWDYDIAADRAICSEAHFRLLGVEPAPSGETSSELWMTAILPEDRAAFQAAWQRAEKSRELFASEYRIRRQDDGDIVHLHATGEFTYDLAGKAVRFRGVVFDVTELKRHQQRQQVLINELNHRVKNTLAIVQSIAMQTLRGQSEVQAREDFIARLTTLARGHDLLALESWEGASLSEVVSRAIEPHSDSKRIRVAVDSPSVWMPPRQALALTMALHELCTNAAKYGALSNETGYVELSWKILEGGDRFRLTWHEHGGPTVEKPHRRGFGSMLLERGLKQDLGGDVQIEFRPAGVRCTIEAPAPRSFEPVELDLKKGA